jgi:hypothetical protein
MIHESAMTCWSPDEVYHENNIRKEIYYRSARVEMGDLVTWCNKPAIFHHIERFVLVSGNEFYAMHLIGDGGEIIASEEELGRPSSFQIVRRIRDMNDV